MDARALQLHVARLMPDVLNGEVIEPDRDRLPQAMIESTTEFDYVHLPDDLRSDLREWCQRFTAWAAAQPLP